MPIDRATAHLNPTPPHSSSFSNPWKAKEEGSVIENVRSGTGSENGSFFSKMGSTRGVVGRKAVVNAGRDEDDVAQIAADYTRKDIPRFSSTGENIFDPTNALSRPTAITNISPSNASKGSDTGIRELSKKKGEAINRTMATVRGDGSEEEICHHTYSSPIRNLIRSRREVCCSLVSCPPATTALTEDIYFLAPTSSRNRDLLPY